MSAAEGVSLPEGYTASSLLHEVLRDAAQRHPEALAGAELPADAQSFRKRYPDALPRFEACRASSTQRSAIARDVVRASAARLRFRSEQGELALDEHLARPGDALAVETLAPGPPTRLAPSVPWNGRTYAGKDLHELADAFLEQHLMTRAAADALRWVAEQAVGNGGIDLSGHKFAVLGAGAELAATPLLLEAGASVLWIDVDEPPDALRELAARTGGTLAYAAGGADLLTQPREIAATIARFAWEDPVHLALYAYAAGRGREWRVAAAMNGIVRCLDPERVRSVTLLVSPTSPAVVQPEDLEAAGRYPVRGWQSLLERAGRLPHARSAVGPVEVARAIVAIQGASYQAAQYVEKLLFAETLATWGTRPDAGSGSPVRVSANVAGISRTRSLSHPVFDAGFLGAGAFGVRTFEPATTSRLSGLLALHDLLAPDVASGPPAVFAKQVHGGIYALPWELDSCITVAALIGLARRPRLLWGIVRGR